MSRDDRARKDGTNVIVGPDPSAWSRRTVLAVAVGCAGPALVVFTGARAEPEDESAKLVADLTGKTPIFSERVHLAMPKVFPNGYTVPLALSVDSPMTDSDHVKYVRVLAPKNPLIEVATFHFVAGRSRPRVSTRIRLAKPQFVVAVAELSDGALLMTKTWVDVASDGCK